MLSTMQDVPLTVSSMFVHGQRVHRRSRVLTFDGEAFTEATFAEVGARTERLAAALRRLGVAGDERVATFMWNSQEHLEAYFAVPGIGAVLHTLNIRLPADQLIHIANHAEDKVVLVARHRRSRCWPRWPAELKTVEHVVVVDDGAPLGDDVRARAGRWRRARLRGRCSPPRSRGFDWPELDERSAAAMCFTSGTTGDPKGVVYSHRSTWLHAFGANNTGGPALSERDRRAAHRPAVPRQRLGLPLRGVDARRRHRHAVAVLAGEPRSPR